MFHTADILAPALLSYRGSITDPNRWSTWKPRQGDVLICTPPKSGTTWTQTMVAMLFHENSVLTEAVPVMSPWVDADLGVPASEVAETLARQTKRRVVKTHTPADGFPLWEGVKVISVLVLSRFSSGLFRAMFAMKEIENGNEIHGRVST